LVDGVVLVPILFLLLAVIDNETVAALTYFLIFLFNEWILVALRGQQVGKMALGIRIVDETTGEPPGFGMAFLRGLVADFFLSPFWALWDQRRQGLQDKAAHTLVVRAS
jgi:uncharacterized RDD family membrane protein YckC